MRRFIAYLLASITIFLGIGIAFKPIVTSINADLSYRDGKAITYKLVDKDQQNSEQKIEIPEDAAKNYAPIIEQRLKAFAVTDYKIEVKGNDEITVTFAADNQTEYDYVSKILTASTKISLSTPTDSALVDEEHATWHNSNAYITYDGSTSVVVMNIPENLKVKVKELYDKAKEEEPQPEPESNEANDDPQPEPASPSIIMWFDRAEGDEYANKETDANVKAKIFHEFTTSDFYYGSDENAFQIKFTPASASKLDVQNAYREALCTINVLNASETEYKVSAIHTEIVPANVENLLVYGTHVNIAMSATFIAFIIAFCVISLILSLFYHITSIAIMTTTSLTTFLTFMTFTFFKPLFNISAIVGILLVAISSIFVGVAHNNYLHEEVYKGRSLKKANYEASKKTTLLTIDISVVMAILGILIYFVGGVTVASLGTMLIFGSVANIIFNTFFLKGLMWLVTNNTNFQDKYKIFNIEADRIPDLSKEEKPSYLGPYEKRNFGKHKKVTGIIVGVVTIASVVGMIVFSVTGKAMFNTGNYFTATNELHLTYESKDEPSNLPTVAQLKDNVFTQIENNGKVLKYQDNIKNYEYTYDVSLTGGKSEKTYVTKYIVTLDENSLEANTFKYKDTTGNFTDVLRVALEKTFPQLANEENYIIKVSQAYNLPSNASFIILANVTAIVAVTIYLWIRYRASRAATVGFISLTGAVATIGTMCLTRLVATPVMAVAASLTTVISLAFGLYLLHKDKDLIRDERVRDLSTRKTVLKKAFTMALSPASIFAVVSIYLCINFFGFGSKEFLAVFLSAAIGSVASIALYFTLFTTFADYFDAQFARVKIPEIKIRKKKQNTKKDNELSEATFIGIND